MIYIGTAGWSIPRTVAEQFPGEGSHLARYARQFSAVEINSTFYRPHKVQTFARWAESVPADFRFAVKIPKTITHELKLVGAAPLLAEFLWQIEPLAEKLGCLLIQLPPSLQFDGAAAARFFDELRSQYDGEVSFEPRHITWFGENATQLLVENCVARVGADPALVPDAAVPGGHAEFVYLRLHGSPRVYYSAYPDAVLNDVARTLLDAAKRGANSWCIFDNTASGAAAADALRLRQLVTQPTAV